MGKYTKIKADGGPIKTVRISDKGEVKDVPINTKKYKEYYDSKTLAKASEDPNLLIAAQDLNPYEVKAEKPTWLTFKEEALKNYPESKFRNEYFLPALRPSDLDSLPQNALDEYNKRINNTVAQRLLKERNLDKNWEPKDQVGAFTQGERDIILNSDYGEDLARNVRLYDAELADKESFSNSGDKADLFRRQNQAIGEKTSLQRLPYIGQYIPNILDVTGGIGNMASNVAAVPYNINEGNLLAAGLGIAAPVGVGRLASIGAPTTAQFVNNLVNPLAGTGNLIKGAGKYLTTQTPLKNAYKVNPFAFKPNPESYYRMVGEQGVEDALKTEVIRTPKYDGKDWGKRTFDKPYFHKGHPIDGRNYKNSTTYGNYGGPGMVEIPKDFPMEQMGKARRNNFVPKEVSEIPLENAKLYKQDWLKGYKQVKPGVTTTPQIAPQQMGINLKGAFQKYPKDKLTPTQLDAITVNNPNYKSIPEYYDRIAAENGKEARRIYNSLYHGGSNWEAADYITAGAVGGVAPAMLGLYGYALAPGTVRNKLDRPESLVDRDTTIDLTNAPMDYAKVNETKDGKVIIGGEFIENANNTVRTAKDWLTATDTYSDKKYPSKDIQSFYGVENGKFKVGKANEFSPKTEIVPRRFGESNINKAVLNGDEMRILDKEGKPIYQNTPNKGKFILYSPSSKKAEFTFINSGKTGVNKVNDFIQKNKDAQYIHLDNGRYEYYGLNKRGLSGHDFKNYYEQDWDREGNPGYNLVVKQYGGYINNNMNRKKYADGGPKKKAPIAVNDLNDPRLKAYADSSAAYNLTTKYDPIFKANTTDPRMKDYDRAAANITRRTGIAPATIKTDSWEDPMPRNFSPGAMEQAWMGRFKKPTQPYIYAPRQETLDINSIQYNPKDTNPYNKYVVNRYLPTPESPVNPIPYDDIQLYTAHQYLANQGKPVGQIHEDGKWRDMMADEYNSMNNTNYAMGGMIKRKDGSYSKRGLWDNIRANKGSGKEPTKEMLEQEAKIKAKYPDGGYIDTPPNDMPLNLPLKEQNPYLVPEYNQPMANGYILPDINRPRLLPEVNASEYKSTQGTDTGDVQIPTIVGGQYIGDNGAWERYKNTGERFKTMKDPSSYSKYYDEYYKLHPKAMAMGGRMNQAQQLNAAKMRTGSEQGNSFGDYAGDIGKIMLNNIVSPIEGLTGAEIYNPNYSTDGLEKVGNFYGKMQTQMGKMLPQALNMIAPGVGTAVGAGGKGVGNMINSTGEQEMEQMGQAMKYAQGGLMHINEGGTHEQNALGGVPIGPNALVEQGETINNDFVFSDRLKPKGSKRTYAQLSKSVDTKYRLRPDDKLSKEAKQMDLDRLAMQQETQKDEMSTKYMQKAMACGGKIKGFGGSFQGPISQSMNVTNGQNTMLAMGGNLPNYDYGDDGNIRRSPYNNMVNAVDNGINNVNYQPSNDVLFNDYMQRDGFNPTLEDYNKVVLGQKQAAMGGLMSNFMEKPTVYQNPANLSNQYAMGGNMYGNGGFPDDPYAYDASYDITNKRPLLAAEEEGNPYTMQNYNQRYLSNLDNIPTSILENRGFGTTSSGGIYNGPDEQDMKYIDSDPSSTLPTMDETYPKIDINSFYASNSPLTGVQSPTPYQIQSGIPVPQMIQPTPEMMRSSIAPNTYAANNAELGNMGQKQGNAFDKYAGTNQNPYPEVGNTGYLTNLAGNLIKAGMVATSKPPIYNPSLKLNRMNANPAERLAMQEGRREIQGTKDIIRNNATSSGQYLTNASLMGSSAANKLAGTIGGIRQGYDQQNVGIGNQEAQLNQQITSGNNLAKETFRDNRLNQYNKILDSVIGANQQRFSTDVHANNYQNQVVEFLKTKGFRIGYKDGKLQMLDANNNVVNTEK